MTDTPDRYALVADGKIVKVFPTRAQCITEAIKRGMATRSSIDFVGGPHQGHHTISFHEGVEIVRLEPEEAAMTDAEVDRDAERIVAEAMQDVRLDFPTVAPGRWFAVYRHGPDLMVNGPWPTKADAERPTAPNFLGALNAGLMIGA